MPKATLRPPPELGWCPKCGRRREIVDEFDDVTLVPAGQVGVHVTAFECGHSTFHEDGTFYPL